MKKSVNQIVLKVFKLFTIGFFLFNSYAQAQENYMIGAASEGMGNATVMKSDIWSAFHNQAGLANLESLEIGTYYSNIFGMKELARKSVVVAMPIKQMGVFAISFNNMGYSKYGENKFGLAYAKKLGKRISAGIQLNYFNTNISNYNTNEYGSENTVTAELGIQMELVDNLLFGVHVFNPFSMTKEESNKMRRMPSILRLGLGYNFDNRLLVSIETEKDIDRDMIFKAGLEYKLIKYIYLRTGISTNPNKYSYGLGVNYKNIKVDFTVSNHEILGYTPHFSLGYAF